MNGTIRLRLMDWRSARVAFNEGPNHRSALALQQTRRKHRAAVRLSLSIVGKD